MDKSRLAALQKRLQSWQLFLTSEDGVQSPALRQVTAAKLAEFRTLLTQAWKAPDVTPEFEVKLTTVLRELEQLNEAARVSVEAKAAT
jgi:hypothetical protein